MKRLSILVLIILTLGVNYWLLQNFNTLTWPYLWPRPGIFILVVFFVIALWFRELFSGVWLLRVVGLWMIFIGQSYLIHTFQVTFEHFSVAALTHLIGFTGTFLVMTLNYINQITPKSNKTAPPLPQEVPYVAAIIPTYGEPYEILEKTIVYLKQLDYPADRLYILISDDGHRDEIRHLAELHQIHYNPGAKKDAKAGNLNSALKYLEQHFPQVTLILTQDADEIIDSSFLQKTVGYFQDAKLAFVQTPKEAFTPKGDPFGNRDRVFYDILQPGRNGSGAAFSCGSGVIWRIAALKAIGGFVTWNLVEDMTTSYFLHSAGYRSEYHNEVMTAGLSPDDIPGLLKQRGTWAADTWRFFLFNNPLRRPGLSLRQRLQYFELGMFYVASTLFMPTLMLTPILSVATGDFIPIEGSALFPWLAISFLYYIVLAQGDLTLLNRMWQYWVGHWPTYTKAFWVAVRSRHKKPSYKVTRKTRQDGFYGQLIWPQFLYLLVGLSVIVYGLFWLTEVRLSTRLANIGILLFFMYMVSQICRSAFYSISFGFLDNLQVRAEALFRQARPLLRIWQLAVYPIRFGLESTVFSTRQLPRLHRLVIPSVAISTLLSAGFIGGSGFVWQNTLDKTVAGSSSLNSPVYFVRQALAQSNQDISVNVASKTKGALSPRTRTIPPTPTSRPFTNTPSPTPTTILTNTPTSVPPATRTRTATPTPLPTESAILTTPIITIGSADSPTPITMKYAAPVLVEPQDQFAYIKGNTPVLRWEAVSNLAANEQYAVRIVYRFQNEVVYKGAQVKEPEWTIPLSLFGQVDGPAYLYEWFVVVERLNDDDSATAISPESGRHSFTWK